MFEKLNNGITSPSHPIFKYFKKDKGTNQPPWLIGWGGLEVVSNALVAISIWIGSSTGQSLIDYSNQFDSLQQLM